MEEPLVDAKGFRRNGASSWVSNEVTTFAPVLKGQWLLYDLPGDPSPTCEAFIIPKTSKQVSLILSCVNHNALGGCTPPRFSLQSLEQLSKLLTTFYLGVLLYGIHIDLKNVFYSFVVPETSRTLFRRSGPSGRVMGLGRLPFWWKYSPYICLRVLARLVEAVPPPPFLLVHYLDDFLLVHHNKLYPRRHTGGTVLAIEEGGFIVSPKSVLEPATQLVFWGKWLDLLGRVVWSHEVADLDLLGGLALPESPCAVVFGFCALASAPPGGGMPFLQQGRTAG